MMDGEPVRVVGYQLHGVTLFISDLFAKFYFKKMMIYLRILMKTKHSSIACMTLGWHYLSFIWRDTDV